MNSLQEVLQIAKSINSDICDFERTNGFSNSNDQRYNGEKCSFDELITNKSLRKKTRKLFMDGHHARAVEEAYKLIDNFVKKKSNLFDTPLSGSSLMNKAFSPNNPILKLNECKTTSEKDEQTGFMQIYSGCMTGIRNPRAHETDWEDTKEHALELLIFANYLMERAQLAEVRSKDLTSL